MKKTFLEIRTFNGAVENFLKRNPKNLQSKLGYAIEKVNNAGISKAIREYQKAQNELYLEEFDKPLIDLAITDKITGEVLTTPKDSEYPYKFDREGLKKARKINAFYMDVLVPNFREDWDKKEYEITPHFASILPADLTPRESDAFMGFAIDPDKETPREQNMAAGLMNSMPGGGPGNPVTGGPSPVGQVAKA